jgi:hypothetical protein
LYLLVLISKMRMAQGILKLNMNFGSRETNLIKWFSARFSGSVGNYKNVGIIELF